MDIDMNELTAGDVEDIEEYAGLSFTEMNESGFPGKGMTALIWVTQRRTDPSFTIEQARAVKVSKINVKTNGVDPTVAAGSGS